MGHTRDNLRDTEQYMRFESMKYAFLATITKILVQRTIVFNSSTNKTDGGGLTGAENCVFFIITGISDD